MHRSRVGERGCVRHRVYVRRILRFHGRGVQRDAGPTAIIFGITLLFFFGFGIVSGPLSDRVGPHRLLGLGGILFVVGLLITSQVEHLVLGYLTYGIGVGLGSGLFTAPMTAVVGRLFVRQRALAFGVTAVGNGLGTLVLVPLSSRVIDDHGWRTAYVVLACIGAVAFSIAYPAVRATAANLGVVRTIVSPRVLLADSFFASLFASTLLMSIGLYLAFAFVVPFAKDEGVAAGPAARLMALVGLASIGGRLVLTGLTRRFGPLGVFKTSLAIQPVAYVVWLIAGGRYPLLVIFALVLGVSYGGFVAILPELMISRFGVADVGSRSGTLFLSFGLGGLIGPPAGGWIADASDGRVVPIIVVIVLLIAAVATSTRLRALPLPGD